MKLLNGCDRFFTVVAGGFAHVAHILELNLHAGDIVPFHAFLRNIFGRVFAVDQSQRLFAGYAVLIQLEAKLFRKINLPLKQANSSPGGRTVKLRRFIQLQEAEFHEPLL
ncbi:hypothetical protein SDC9_187013 [bioreactor metagenome]|uniref:Uncharacterized protein n=1 Tax=bioreactor metagenome TaxID=1076179 RepID=A0A645HKE2_9ZZZZ